MSALSQQERGPLERGQIRGYAKGVSTRLGNWKLGPGRAGPGLWAWGTTADLFVQRFVSFIFIGGAAATGSLGQNNSLKPAIETSEIMLTNVGYLHSYVGYAPVGYMAGGKALR